MGNKENIFVDCSKYQNRKDRVECFTSGHNLDDVQSYEMEEIANEVLSTDSNDKPRDSFNKIPNIFKSSPSPRARTSYSEKLYDTTMEIIREEEENRPAGLYPKTEQDIEDASLIEQAKDSLRVDPGWEHPDKDQDEKIEHLRRTMTFLYNETMGIPSLKDTENLEEKMSKENRK